MASGFLFNLLLTSIYELAAGLKMRVASLSLVLSRQTAKHSHNGRCWAVAAGNLVHQLGASIVQAFFMTNFFQIQIFCTELGVCSVVYMREYVIIASANQAHVSTIPYSLARTDLVIRADCYLRQLGEPRHLRYIKRESIY